MARRWNFVTPEQKAALEFESAKRPWIGARPSCLRYAVAGGLQASVVRKKASELSRKTGWESGVYVLVRCPPNIGDRAVVRAALRLETDILYIGLSETKWQKRLSLLSSGLSGGSLRHDAARRIARANIDPNEIRLVLISFSPAFSLESFLIDEYVAQMQDYPIFNFARGCRSSTAVLKTGTRIGWSLLFACLRLRASPEDEVSARNAAILQSEHLVARLIADRRKGASLRATR